MPALAPAAVLIAFAGLRHWPQRPIDIRQSCLTERRLYDRPKPHRRVLLGLVPRSGDGLIVRSFGGSKIVHVAIAVE